MYINIFSALLLNGDSSFTQAKKPPCELNTLCVLTTAATRAHIWPVKYIWVNKTPKIRKLYNQVPHLTQDTTWESDKNTIKYHKQEPRGQLFPNRWPHRGNKQTRKHEKHKPLITQMILKRNTTLERSVKYLTRRLKPVSRRQPHP